MFMVYDMWRWLSLFLLFHNIFWEVFVQMPPRMQDRNRQIIFPYFNKKKG